MRNKSPARIIKYSIVPIVLLIITNMMFCRVLKLGVVDDLFPKLPTIIITHVCIISSVYIVLLGILINTKKITEAGFFLLTSICFGLIMMVLVPAWSIPDSGSHYIATYRFSNKLLGLGKEFEWYGRKEDCTFFAEIWNRNVNPNTFSYGTLANNIHLLCKDSELIKIPFSAEYMTYYSPINYLPQIIGLTIGRLLGLGSAVCIYLARFFVLIFYSLGCFYSIKKTPVGKSIFAFVCLLPMPLMIGNSFSYDAIVIIVTMNFIASIFRLSDNMNSKFYFIEALICSFLLGATKAGGYVLLLPLVIVLARKRHNKKSIIYIISIIFTCVASMLLFDLVLQDANNYFQLGSEDSPNLSASWAYMHPFNYLKLCFVTFAKQSPSLVLGMMGEYLGWLEKTLPKFLLIFMGIIIIAYSLLEKDKVNFGKKDVLACVLSIFMMLVIAPSMLLSSTPIGSNTIMGLQGRYFLPILPIILLLLTKSLRSKKISKIIASTKTSEKIRFSLMYTYSLLMCIAIYYMLRMYLCR